MIFDNLVLLNEYRCSNVHFIKSKLDPAIFMLISKAVLNYNAFLKKYFKKDITRDDNLIILPIGLKLPFDPVDYLKQNYSNAHNDFINDVIQSVHKLNDDGVQDSIVVGFNLVTDKVRNVKNADIIAALSNSTGAVELRRGARVTDDPHAPVVRIEPDIPPLRYADLRIEVKEKEASIKFGNVFNRAMKIIKADKALCQVRYLDPKNKSGLKTEFYDERAIDVLIRTYHELEATQ
ncbi:hypothetical protein NIE88_09555 [Sporolactobacillus shoreicorticis]|uniref:DUF3644 domain-containing protein n=1 Tax=Sporolactobacillus shoreicorticis TaxID=1923877 RepID=A0ABW5S7W7_9BACL|nr:DUF3644 domain-containing protein [Sporolactobacillus shoreicorticis]MCO7126020.1 hypothetical protein [Sporolactobacillus shoreicorticis]